MSTLVRLAQVIANLLNNAAKYTDIGGKILIQAYRRGHEISVIVKDSGVGISPEMLPRVFDLFTQVGRIVGQSQGGLGIGLALVRSLVELHGGVVEAHSEGRGQGSEFTIRFASGACIRYRPRIRAKAPNSRRPERRVLVIDDDQDVADSLVLLLQEIGAEAHAAYGGADGLKALESSEPNLAFVDLGMPEIDGYEVARKIRQRFSQQHLTLVALTGWGQSGDRQRTREAGFDRDLTKPASVEDLQELLTLV